MKLFLTIFLAFLLSLKVFSQDAHIELSDGSKVGIQESSVRLISFENKIIYKSTVKNSEQSINFNDFDCIYYSNFKFKSVGLNRRKEKDGYFVLAETKTKILLSKIIITQPQEDEEEAPKPKYQLLVTDNEYNTLASLMLDAENNSKSVDQRNLILPLIKLNFATCDNLVNRATDFEKKNGDQKNLSILGLFNSPLFIDCK